MRVIWVTGGGADCQFVNATLTLENVASAPSDQQSVGYIFMDLTRPGPWPGHATVLLAVEWSPGPAPKETVDRNSLHDC